MHTVLVDMVVNYVYEGFCVATVIEGWVVLEIVPNYSVSLPTMSNRGSGVSKKAKYKGKRFRKENEKAELILTNLAQILDECQRHKLNIKLRHGIVMSKYGYVLPLKRGWVVRMLIDNPHAVDDDENY